MCKRIGALALGAFLTVHNSPRLEAGAFATEFTQLLNHGQLIMQYIRQGEQLANEIKMYEDMLRNVKALSGQIYGPIAADINSLSSIVQGGMALGIFHGQSRRAVPNKISRIRLVAERLLSGLQGLVTNHTRHYAGCAPGSWLAGAATAKRTSCPQLLASHGAKLGRANAGSTGAWRDLRTAGSATHEATGVDARGPLQQAGVPGHRHSAPGG